MSIWESYKLRWQRKRWRTRALLKRRELRGVANRTSQISRDDVLLFCTVRDEHLLLPYFFEHYRRIGVKHFFFVDNGSTDGSLEYLAEQPDVSVWQTDASYRKARFGIDWIAALQRRYAHDHWTLTVDVDEFFVYPFCDTRPLRALADWLDASAVRSFGALLLDMYPKGPVDEQPYARGANPFETCAWFDGGNYTLKPNPLYKNLWIQGGPRARLFFADQPDKAPALNKIPFVRWHRRYAYVSSTHMMLPRGLNLVYDQSGGEKTSGILLHAKFLNTFTARAQKEITRGEHYQSAKEYISYLGKDTSSPNLWCNWSERYTGWKQLEELGLMSKGNWA